MLPVLQESASGTDYSRGRPRTIGTNYKPPPCVVLHAYSVVQYYERSPQELLVGTFLRYGAQQNKCPEEHT